MSNLKKLNTQAEYDAFKESIEFILPNVSLIVDGKIVKYNKKEVNPNTQIMYTSNDNTIIQPYSSNFGGANIISNTYENGVGIIEFDAEVTTIGTNAFKGCSGLTSTTIPNTVTSIGSYAFKFCSGLTSIEIPNSVTLMDTCAFQDCTGLTSITIPNSVTRIGSGVFKGCSGLTLIVMSTIVPPTLSSTTVFNNTHSNLQIYVPDESVDAYKAATNWSSYASKIKPMSQKSV